MKGLVALSSFPSSLDWLIPLFGEKRTFVEVQQWPAMGAVEKRAIWRRITLEGSAWRFNKYAERAAESK